jgi:hypothetical protein
MIAINGALHASAVRDDPSITDAGWPWREHMGDRIDLLGVAGAHRDSIGALSITRDLVVAPQAAASAKQEGHNRRECEGSQGHVHSPSCGS